MRRHTSSERPAADGASTSRRRIWTARTGERSVLRVPSVVSGGTGCLEDANRATGDITPRCSDGQAESPQASTAVGGACNAADRHEEVDVWVLPRIASRRGGLAKKPMRHAGSRPLASTACSSLTLVSPVEGNAQRERWSMNCDGLNHDSNST